MLHKKIYYGLNLPQISKMNVFIAICTFIAKFLRTVRLMQFQSDCAANY